MMWFKKKKKLRYHIICEGIDSSGKSSFVNYLNSITTNDTIVHHFGTPPRTLKSKQQVNYQFGQFSLMFELIEDIVKQESTSRFIFDRAHLGEYVYSPLFRKIDPTYLPRLEQHYEHLKNQIFIILFTIDPKVLQKRFATRDEEMPNVVRMMDIQEDFRMMYRKSKFKGHTFTINSENERKFTLEKMIDILNFKGIFI